MISLTTGSLELSRRFCDACRIFKTTVSFGSVNSLCEMPCTMSHASIPAEERTLPQDLVRLSIGIEDPRDLIADLARALDIANNEPANSQRDARVDWYDSKFEDLPVLPRPPPAIAEASAEAQPRSEPHVASWTQRSVEPSTREPASSNLSNLPSDLAFSRMSSEEADPMRHSVRSGNSLSTIAAAAAGAVIGVSAFMAITAAQAARANRR